jgi:hypothetical protein
MCISAKLETQVHLDYEITFKYVPYYVSHSMESTVNLKSG